MVETQRAWAPGRANLIGEHTDYNAGLCLPIALPWGTTVSWQPDGSFGPLATLVLHSEGMGSWRGTVGDLAAPGSGWARYALGALSAIGHQLGGELQISSTVPSGAGLSSSAAVICAVLRAVSDLPNEQLVRPAIEAETRWAQAPTGGLDQTISLLGAPHRALLLDFATGERRQVAWRPEADGLHVLVIDSGVRHSNAAGGYGQRRAECEAAAQLLGVPHVSAAGVEGARGVALADLPEPLGRRATHVLSENGRVTATVAAAADRDWGLVGELFNASHRSLRDDFEVSCPELDLGVEAAVRGGALGARMTGGGFGGSFVVLAADPEAVTATVHRAFAAAGLAAPRMHEAPASAGASRLE